MVIDLDVPNEGMTPIITMDNFTVGDVLKARWATFAGCNWYDDLFTEK